MQRVTRGLAGDHIYHVLIRGNGRQEVFHKNGDYAAFIDLMKKAKERRPIKIFAYLSDAQSLSSGGDPGKGGRIKPMDAMVDDQSCASLPSTLWKQ